MSKLCWISDLGKLRIESIERVSAQRQSSLLCTMHFNLWILFWRLHGCKKNKYLHWWLMPPNGMQDGTPCDGYPVVHRPRFMPLDSIIKRDILHSFHFNYVLIQFVLKGKRSEYLSHPKGNCEYTKAHLWIGNRIAFFNKNYQRCWSGVGIIWNRLRRAWRGCWRTGRSEWTKMTSDR